MSESLSGGVPDMRFAAAPGAEGVASVYYRVYAQLHGDTTPPPLTNAAVWGQALEVALLAVLRAEQRPGPINLLAAAESVRWTTLTEGERRGAEAKRRANDVVKAMRASYFFWRTEMEASADPLHDDEIVRNAFNLHRSLSRLMKTPDGQHPELGRIFAAVDAFLMAPPAA